MKQILLCMIAALVFVGCAKEEEAGEKSEAGAEQPSRIARGVNGENIVILDADTQKTLGLQTAALAGTQLNPEIKAFGRVVDPMNISTAVADSVSANAAASVSQKELERVKTLAAQENASPRALESAEATAKRDAIQAESARTHLLAVAGKVIAERDDLPVLVQSLASGESALIQVSLPAGEVLTNEPTNARIVAIGESNPVEAKFIGQSAAIDPQTQSRGYLFLVETNSARLVAGEAVTAYLSVGTESQNGVIVPRAAVIRHGGATFVFLETSGTNFTRQAISLGPPLKDGWFVTEGAKAGDQIVTTGAQSILSEELNSSGFLSGERD